MDAETKVADLRKLVDDFCTERDWFQFHDPKNVAEALSIEASELLEHFLWKSKEEIAAQLARDERYREAIADELADVFGYVLQMAQALELDLTSALKRKYEKNAMKYPVEKAKGRAVKYTDL